MPFVENLPFSIFDAFLGYDWSTTFFYVKVISGSLSFLFFSWWFYSFIQLRRILRPSQPVTEQPQDVAELAEPLEAKIEEKKEFSWPDIVSRLHSDDVDDWRFSVIEADIFMDEVLRVRGYFGQTFEERIATVKQSNLESVPLLERAHGIALKLTHDTNYVISLEEAREALGYFESVLKEMKEI